MLISFQRFMTFFDLVYEDYIGHFSLSEVFVNIYEFSGMAVFLSLGD